MAVTDTYSIEYNSDSRVGTHHVTASAEDKGWWGERGRSPDVFILGVDFV